MSKRHRIVGSTGLVALLAAIVSGCAELQAALVEAECNPDGAYAAGMNDGKNGEDMNAYYANDCPPDAGIQAAYRSGYQFGLAHSTSGTSTTPAALHWPTSSPASTLESESLTVPSRAWEAAPTLRVPQETSRRKTW